MGIFKQAMQSVIADEATQAAESGAVVFTPRLNLPTGQQDGFSGAIKTWSDTVAAIEAAGWRLDQWAIGSDTKGRPEAYPLFRRA